MRRGWGLRVSSLVCFLVDGAAQGAYAIRSFSVEHYDVSLILDFSAHAIRGTEKLRIKAGSNSVAEITLDADKLQVQSVKSRSREQRFAVEPGLLRIELEHAIQAGRSMELTVSYSATPGKGLYFFPDQAYTVYSTSHWMVVNHRNDNLAALDLSITAPANMTVLANGDHVRTRHGGVSELVAAIGRISG